MIETKRGRGRPRREGADDQILGVALEMLRETGYAALTVDAVAERAGVAKTTVYRRWPSKSALIAAAVEPLQSEDPVEILRYLDGADIDVVAAILRPPHARARGRGGGGSGNRRAADENVRDGRRSAAALAAWPPHSWINSRP
jgi:AcrR family transcriptional regulator